MFNIHICHKITGNEEDVADTDFELQATLKLKNLYFLPLYARIYHISAMMNNQVSSWHEVWMKIQHFEWTTTSYHKSVLECWQRLILLDQVTYTVLNHCPSHLNNVQLCCVSLLYVFCPIAFVARVTYWLQCARSLPCVRVFTAL